MNEQDKKEYLDLIRDARSLLETRKITLPYRSVVIDALRQVRVRWARQQSGERRGAAPLPVDHVNFGTRKVYEEPPSTLELHTGGFGRPKKTPHLSDAIESSPHRPPRRKEIEADIA
jgi:hypothetical protein